MSVPRVKSFTEMRQRKYVNNVWQDPVRRSKDIDMQINEWLDETGNYIVSVHPSWYQFRELVNGVQIQRILIRYAIVFTTEPVECPYSTGESKVSAGLTTPEQEPSEPDHVDGVIDVDDSVGFEDEEATEDFYAG